MPSTSRSVNERNLLIEPKIKTTDSSSPCSVTATAQSLRDFFGWFWCVCSFSFKAKPTSFFLIFVLLSKQIDSPQWGGGKWFFRFSCLFPRLRVSYLLISRFDNLKLLVFSPLLFYSLSHCFCHFYYDSISYSESNIIKELLLSDFYNSYFYYFASDSQSKLPNFNKRRKLFGVFLFFLLIF